MTNEQLYFHTKQLRDRLAVELEKATTLMPDTVPCTPVRRHKPIECSARFFRLCINASHFEEVREGDYVPLASLVTWLNELDDDLELLRDAIKRENQAVESAA